MASERSPPLRGDTGDPEGDYQRLQRTDLSFTEAFDTFKESVDLSSLGIEPELFASARDRSPGRTVHS